MIVLSCKYSSPAWGTDRIGTKAVIKTYSLIGDPVNIRCLINLASITAHSMGSVVITHDE
jgi:hypothetical protein